MLVEQFLELEQDACALERRGFAPCGERGFRGLHCSIHFLDRRQRDRPCHLTRRGIEHFLEAAAGRGRSQPRRYSGRSVEPKVSLVRLLRSLITSDSGCAAAFGPGGQTDWSPSTVSTPRRIFPIQQNRTAPHCIVFCAATVLGAPRVTGGVVRSSALQHALAASLGPVVQILACIVGAPDAK